ncbi:DNA-binding protein [Microbacterium enclense]|uniref:DNA-binding protein n=2 Tax=Microbacterium enclense TaxID=993073 RepID=A0A443J8I7_9MICO|nr:DNA-binding protein [Microbacterium enclense]
MRVDELAGALGVKQGTFWLWARTGRVPAFKLASRWYCIPSEVVADITRDRGLYARRDESVVYRELEDKLRGTPRVPIGGRHEPVGKVPGLIEPAAAATRCVEVPGADRALLNANELATAMNCSMELIYRLTRANEIPSIALGNRYRYDLDAVKAALAKPRPAVEQIVPGSWQQSRRSRARRRVI